MSTTPRRQPAPQRENPQKVMGAVERVPAADLLKLSTLDRAIQALVHDDRYHLRSIKRIEAEFHDNGTVTMKVLRNGDVAAMFAFDGRKDPEPLAVVADEHK